MKLDVLLGLQWGDEGKGKVVDVLTPRYDAVARFQGGPNAGHTLEFDGKKHVLRSIPSGIFQKGSKNIIGNGVVLDPILFMEEAKALEADGIKLHDILTVSSKAHVILPTHRLLDAASESAKGQKKIGTTGKGIGPAYTDKVSRSGLRVGDLIAPDFLDRYHEVVTAHVQRLERLGKPVETEDFIGKEKEWIKAVEYLRTFDIIDTSYLVNDLLGQGKKVLCEGAQGTMLDIDFGSYPYVTSSNTVSAGACTGLGVAPNKVGDVFGIFKAYCTRVGEGPFPTELFDETGKKIRDIGHEYGAVTGRERRCGWLDLVALKYAAMINGVTKLIMMKSDVLDTFDTVKICTGYDVDGLITDRLPYSLEKDVRPVYKEFNGWKSDLSKCNSPEMFPVAFKDYIKFIEKELGLPIVIISVGPDRSQTIVLDTTL